MAVDVVAVVRGASTKISPPPVTCKLQQTTPKSTNSCKLKHSLRCVHSQKPAAHTYHRRHHRLTEACCRTVTSVHTIGKHGEGREIRGGTDTRMVSLSLESKHYKQNSSRPSTHSAPPAGEASQRTTTNSVCTQTVLTPRTNNEIGTHAQTPHGQTHIRTHTHARTHTRPRTHTHATHTTHTHHAHTTHTHTTHHTHAPLTHTANREAPDKAKVRDIDEESQSRPRQPPTTERTHAHRRRQHVSTQMRCARLATVVHDECDLVRSASDPASQCQRETVRAWPSATPHHHHPQHCARTSRCRQQARIRQ